MEKKTKKTKVVAPKKQQGVNGNDFELFEGYDVFYARVAKILEEGRRLAARRVNSVLTATYWEIGRYIVEEEQKGKKRAEYGEQLVKKLSEDLLAHFGKGFSYRNLFQMKKFYLVYTSEHIVQTVSALSGNALDLHNLSPKERLPELAKAFSLSWSHYVELLSIRDENERKFYEKEALLAGWGIRQLRRQTNSQFYKRTLLSKNKAAMILKGREAAPEDRITPEETLKDPFLLEFLGLKNEYSESQLEEALIHHLETFLLELGSYFTFVGRQKALRVGDTWFRVDLVFYHRQLRSLVLIDLKIGEFTHADAGQMHLYCNYARENWTLPDENSPVGLILCSKKNDVVVHYALDGLPNKVVAAEYQTELPDEKLLVEEIRKTRKSLETYLPKEENNKE